MNEDSEWWTAVVADMDGATVRRWCMDHSASGVFVDWCWWDGVQVTPGWERARVAFIAWAEVIEARQGAAAGGSAEGRPRTLQSALRRLRPTA